MDINEVVKAIFTHNRQNDAINEPGEYCKILECILENCDKNPALKAKLDISGMLTSAAWDGYFAITEHLFQICDQDPTLKARLNVDMVLQGAALTNDLAAVKRIFLICDQDPALKEKLTISSALATAHNHLEVVECIFENCYQDPILKAKLDIGSALENAIFYNHAAVIEYILEKCDNDAVLEAQIDMMDFDAMLKSNVYQCCQKGIDGIFKVCSKRPVLKAKLNIYAALENAIFGCDKNFSNVEYVIQNFIKAAECIIQTCAKAKDKELLEKIIRVFGLLKSKALDLLRQGSEAADYVIQKLGAFNSLPQKLEVLDLLTQKAQGALELMALDQKQKGEQQEWVKTRANLSQLKRIEVLQQKFADITGSIKEHEGKKPGQ